MGAWLRIVGLCVLASVVYGVLHDQVTARVCLEYFTVGHPRLFASNSPTLHALAWGVIATFWMGAILGVGTAVAGRVGRWPRLAWRDLVVPIGVVLLVMGVSAMAGGVLGWLVFEPLRFQLADWLAQRVAPEDHARYFGVGCAHGVSYGVGVTASVGMWFWIVVERGRRAVRAVPAHGSGAGGSGAGAPL